MQAHNELAALINSLSNSNSNIVLGILSSYILNFLFVSCHLKLLILLLSLLFFFFFSFITATAKKNKRSKSRGLKLDKLIHQSYALLPIEICETMNVLIGANVAALASDTGVVVRKIAPLGAKKWKDVLEFQRTLMINDIVALIYFISCLIVHGLV